MNFAHPPVLAFTGERFAPEITGPIWYEHWHRYGLVAPLVAGRVVLDAACGEGYGSALLARHAREVIGVDIAADSIAHARARYTTPNLRFVEGSCTELPLAEGSVDVIVSFETIEHLAPQREMLVEFRRVLARDGMLIISSPNQPVYSGDGRMNPHHVRELTRDELAQLLTPLFPQQQWYCQSVIAHSAFWREQADARGERPASAVAFVDGELRARADPAPPMYFVVVCAATGVPLPALPALSLFDDGTQSLTRDYERAVQRARELAWDELGARKIAEDRLAELIVAVNDLAAERAQARALAQRVADLERAQAALTVQFAATRDELAATTEALARCNDDLARQQQALGDVAARLAYRESVAGWLRWPLARLKLHLRAAA